jgi:hypothetical protein
MMKRLEHGAAVDEDDDTPQHDRPATEESERLFCTKGNN